MASSSRDIVPGGEFEEAVMPCPVSTEDDGPADEQDSVPKFETPIADLIPMKRLHEDPDVKIEDDVGHLNNFTPADNSTSFTVPDTVSTSHLSLTAPQFQNFTTSLFERVLYSVLHQTVMQVHKQVKTQKANCAAMLIEDLAADNPPPHPDMHHVYIDRFAHYNDGVVTLQPRFNPLAMMLNEDRCPVCRLPRLLYPVMGEASRVPDPDIEYCPRQPHIVLAGHDVHGNPAPTQKAKLPPKKKAKVITEAPASSQSEDDFTPAALPASTPTPRNQFPNVTCAHCNSDRIPIGEFRKHYLACKGLYSRSSARTATKTNTKASAAAAANRNKDISATTTGTSTTVSELSSATSVADSTEAPSRKGTPSLTIKLNLNKGMRPTKTSPARVSSNVSTTTMKTKRARVEIRDDDSNASSSSSGEQGDSDFEEDSAPKKKKLKVRPPQLKSNPPSTSPPPAVTHTPYLGTARPTALAASSPTPNKKPRPFTEAPLGQFKAGTRATNNHSSITEYVKSDTGGVVKRWKSGKVTTTDGRRVGGSHAEMAALRAGTLTAASGDTAAGSSNSSRSGSVIGGVTGRGGTLGGNGVKKHIGRLDLSRGAMKSRGGSASSTSASSPG